MRNADRGARQLRAICHSPRDFRVERVRGGPGGRTSNQTVMSGTPHPEKPEKSDD